MVAYQISTAKFHKILKAAMQFFAVKYITEQLNNDLRVSQARILSVKICLHKFCLPCIQKYVRRKAKANLCRKLLFLLFF